MKKLVMASILALSTFAGAAHASDVWRCGASASSQQLFGPYRSDPGGGNTVNVYPHSSDLRAIVVRSSKGTTRIQRLYAYDEDIRSWRTLVASQIILSEDNEHMICIPRYYDINQVQVQTSGGDNAKFRVMLYYR